MNKSHYSDYVSFIYYYLSRIRGTSLFLAYNTAECLSTHNRWGGLLVHSYWTVFTAGWSIEISGHSIRVIKYTPYCMYKVGRKGLSQYMEMNHIEPSAWCSSWSSIFTSRYIFLRRSFPIGWRMKWPLFSFFLILFIYFFLQRQIYILNCVGEDSINDLVLRLYSPYISAYITEDSPAGESGALGQRVLLLPRHITRREIWAAHDTEKDPGAQRTTTK